MYIEQLRPGGKPRRAFCCSGPDLLLRARVLGHKFRNENREGNVRELYGQTTWMMRSPRGRYTEELLQQGRVCLGWGEAAPDLKAAETPQDFYAVIRRLAPHLRHLQAVSVARQLYKFFREMKVGDPVITYDAERRTYHIGAIAGDAETDPDAVPRLANFRKVEWRHSIQRDQLSNGVRMSLSCQLQLFQPSRRVMEEIERLISQPLTVPGADTAHSCGAKPMDSFTTALASARALIKERLTQLTWMQMQMLVAGVLRAMGYKTKISLPGADKGKDIIASPDGLGLEQPRIFVEVKHQNGRQITAAEIRKFIGGRHAQHDRCLFVSTGGFSTEAEYEAERAPLALTLIDGDDLIDLLLEHYERTDAETRAHFPLRRIYWPA